MNYSGQKREMKIELHQIQRTDKLLLSVSAVLRQLMAPERKDWVNVYFLELGGFVCFFESFKTC